MIILETLAVGFSMFSALPVPQVEWSEKNMRYSLCVFPLVGAVIAAACCVWTLVCDALSAPDLMRGAGLCLLPVLMTGGIHLDGYADTCDALASRADPEKRQAILKDPNIGAFAAIRLCVYFTASLALWSSLKEISLPVLPGMFGLSRCLSGISLTVFPLRKGSGLARTFSDAADRQRVRAVLLALAAVCAGVLCLSDAWPCVPVALAVFLIYRRTAEREFGGLSGDLAGWFLQKSELWMLGALVLWQYGKAIQ